MKPTGVLFFPAFDWAISPTHPEREERLLYTRDQLFEEGIMDLPEIREYKPRLAEPIDIGAVHFVVPDQKASLLEAHFVAAGSTLVLADAYMKGEIKNGFAIVRPPGHHAMTVSHGNRGFCNINNEAIMIEYLRHKYGVKRVAVIDTDVHHGDGTQEIYYHDPDVVCVVSSGWTHPVSRHGVYGRGWRAVSLRHYHKCTFDAQDHRCRNPLCDRSSGITVVGRVQARFGS